MSNIVTKKDFISSFRGEIGQDENLAECVLYASTWWDFCCAFGKQLPFRLNNANIALSQRDLSLFKHKFSEADYDFLSSSRIFLDSKYKSALCNALVAIGLYRQVWVFEDLFDDCHTAVIGEFGSEDEDVSWFVDELAKSVSAYVELGMSDGHGSNFISLKGVMSNAFVSGAAMLSATPTHTDLNTLKTYEQRRGRIPSPQTGVGDYDPICSMMNVVERTHSKFEHTDFVTVTGAEVFEQLKMLVDSELLVKAEDNAVAAKIANYSN